MQRDSVRSIAAQKLTIFSPKKSVDQEKVFVFIHGGSWRSGNKNLYNFLGIRIARKGVVSVIINYPLSPEGDYNDMAFACAMAVKWVHEKIHKFGGDKNKARQFFEDGLQKAFQQTYRSSHPDYPFSVFYAFKQTETEESVDGKVTASTGWETRAISFWTVDGVWV